MTRPLRHLLVFAESLAGDPYLCWLYAAQFAATTDAAAGRAGFLPLFPYRGPQPARLSMDRLGSDGDHRTPRRRKTLWQRLHLSEDPAVTVTSLDAGRRSLLKIVNEVHEGLEGIVLFGRDPVDVAELAKLVHVGCDTTVPAVTCVVQRPGASDIVRAGLRELGIPVYLDVGFDLTQDRAHPSGNGAPDNSGTGACELCGAFSFWSELEYPFAARRGAPADWSAILSTAIRRERAPVVLFLRPDWPSCGSFTTFKSIALRYAERGTVILDVAVEERSRRYSKGDASDRLRDSRHELSPALMFASARSRTLRSAWRARADDGKPGGLVAEHVARYAGAAAPPWMRRLLRACRPDYAYVNHYFTMDYLRKLQLEVPIVLDTHDIQSVNYLHHKYASKGKGRSETFSDLLEQEMRFLERARAVAFVSADELELASARLPGMDMFHFIAIPKVERAAIARVDAGDNRRRILIVASWNPGNEVNVAWFLDGVWPRLRDTGAALDIVGTIAGCFGGKAVPEGCTLHGPVPSLGPYYARSDAVALPVVTGGGVAIKTIEALLYDRPVCATSHAFRGLGTSLRARFPRFDDAEAFADDLRSLIEDPAAARARLELCRAAAAVLAPERFDAAFDERHRAMLASKGKASPITASSALKYRALANTRS